MKKIKLITIYHTVNYGGFLQALATYTILSKFGDVSMLKVKNDYIDSTRRLVRFSFSFMGFLRAGYDLIRLKSRYRQLRKVGDLVEKLLKEDSDFTRHDFSDDILVTGSDQLWNPNVVSGTTQHFPPYLLSNLTAKKKYAIGTSMGSYKPQVTDNFFISCINDFDGIWVREPSSIKDLQACGIDSKTILDPTLLLDDFQWKEKRNNTIGNRFYNLPPRYIFVYGLKKDKLFQQGVRYFRDKLGIPVVSLDTDVFSAVSADIKINDGDAFDFINLLEGSELVLTNSFHGVAFSVNFQREFYAFSPPSSPERVKDLLKQVGGLNRYITDIDELQKNTELDWNKINSSLQLLRKEGSQVYKDLFD